MLSWEPDENYNAIGGTRLWGQGDFTYDGNGDFADLVKLAQNYNAGLPSAATLAGFGSDFAADADAAFADAAVPEPPTLAFAAAGAVLLQNAGRRRSRAHTGHRTQPTDH